MTAIIAIESDRLDQYQLIQQSDLNEVPSGAGIASLQVGDQLSMRDLLYALLLPSGSDAAVVIAHAVAGSTPAFVALMNSKASSLQLYNTHFSNLYGIDASDQYSSAADLTKLAIYAQGNPTFAQIVQQQSYMLSATFHNHQYTWNNTNTLLTAYSGMNGIEVAMSGSAGYCMVFSAYRNGHHLIGAELHAAGNTLFSDVEQLLDTSFSSISP